MPWFKANIAYGPAGHSEYYKRPVAPGQTLMQFVADAMARSAAAINANLPAGAPRVPQGELTIRESGQQNDDPGPPYGQI
jgi:hypothetical protein